MDDNWKTATPGQKLNALTNMLITPIDIIRGVSQLIKKDIESNNINPDDLLEKVTKIAEAAEKIKILRDEAVRSQY